MKAHATNARISRQRQMKFPYVVIDNGRDHTNTVGIGNVTQYVTESAYTGVLLKVQDALLGDNTGQAVDVPLVAVKSASEGSAGSSKLPRCVCFKKCVLVTYPICPRLGMVGDVCLRNKRWHPSKSLTKTEQIRWQSRVSATVGSL